MSIIACSVDGCETPKLKRGMCEKHYQYHHRNGLLGQAKKGRVCTIVGCERTITGKGMCSMHYQRARRGIADVNIAEPVRVSGQTTCTFGDCSKPALSLHLCSMHYWRQHDFGPEGLDRISIHDPRHIVGYSAVHQALRHKRGPARKFDCNHCGGSAEQWAFDHKVDEPLFDAKCHNMPYTTDLSHYIPLCIKCHVALDMQHSY